MLFARGEREKKTGFVWVYFLLALCSSHVGVSCDVIRSIDVGDYLMIVPGGYVWVAFLLVVSDLC